jgi:hypothetical protein
LFECFENTKEHQIATNDKKSVLAHTQRKRYFGNVVVPHPAVITMQRVAMCRIGPRSRELATEGDDEEVCLRLKHRQDAPDVLHAWTEFGREFVWRDGLCHAVLVETQRTNPNIRALGVSVGPLSPSRQCVGNARNFVAPRIYRREIAKRQQDLCVKSTIVRCQQVHEE